MLIVGVKYADPVFVESVRLRYFDQLITSQPAKDVPVHTVNIDEAALDQLGQFPFPRGIYADIIKDLYDRDAGVVVFNILMAEPDRFDQDDQLSKTLEQYAVVLPSVGAMQNKNTAHGSPAVVICALTINKCDCIIAVIVVIPSTRMCSRPGFEAGIST